MFKEIQMAPAVRRIMEQVLALKPGEQVLIVTDTCRPTRVIKLLAAAAAAAGAEVMVLTMKAREAGGIEPPPVVAAAMRAADAVITATTHSLTHTNAQREARRQGARFCNLREINEEMLISGGVTANYREVEKISQKMARLLSLAEEAHVASPTGTDVYLNLKGRQGFALAGFATQPGQFAGLPDGEAYIAPVEGKAHGVIINPYSVDRIGVLREPMKLTIENGSVSRVEGGRQAEELRELMEKTGPQAGNIAEFAIGTNPNCRLTGVVLREDKKKLGTIHIAIGDNLTIGGVVDCPLHLDIIILEPTVELDGQVVLRKGELLV
ncbi:MAG: hypothetical protein PWP65_1663 [Clostridia bacterium]|nr:hypothetical protein [Clostridia bacterium]